MILIALEIVNLISFCFIFWRSIVKIMIKAPTFIYFYFIIYGTTIFKLAINCHTLQYYLVMWIHHI